jgi:membrane-bound lytic murein transglycosylase B
MLAVNVRLNRRPASLLLVAVLAIALASPPALAAARKARPRAVPAASAMSIDYSVREEVRRFAREMVERHQFVESDLLAMFGKVRYSDAVIRLMSPPSAQFKRSWAVYRGRFLDPLRIREGTRFWREHSDTVQRASEQFGVPEEIIVSIIGVETIYGRITGDFRVLDALTVLAFDYPRRAEFFRSELEQFLLFARDNAADVFSVKGSFAGAIGLPQFMPGSIRRFAVDFDNDGRIDLRSSPADAIGSVARFLAEHGWRRGEPTHFQLAYDDEARLRPLIEAGIEPQFTGEQLADYGVRSTEPPPADMKLALIDLPNGDDPASYYLGAQNFYAITRYNRSSFYAMAVIELARTLREAR